MLIYWSACLMSMLFTWFGVHVKHRKENAWYYIKLSFFAALPFIIIASIRYDVGQDYLYTYVPYFERVKAGRVTSALEPLYHLINWIVVKCGEDYPWVFAISAVIFFTLVYRQFFKDSPNVYFSIFLLVGTTYLFIFFNAMRQLIGCSVLLLSLRYARERKLLPFLLVVATAACFHKSCLVFIPFYFFCNVNLKPMTVAVMTLGVLAGSVLLGRLINAIVMYTQYAVYVDSRFDSGEQGYIVLLINLGILVFATVFSSNNEKFRQYYNLQVIATWIAILSGEVVLMSRLRWMFGLPCCILIPLALRNVKKGRRGLSRLLAGAVIAALYLVYVSYTIGIQNGNNVLPYQTIFS